MKFHFSKCPSDMFRSADISLGSRGKNAFQQRERFRSPYRNPKTRNTHLAHGRSVRDRFGPRRGLALKVYSSNLYTFSEADSLRRRRHHRSLSRWLQLRDNGLVESPYCVSSRRRDLLHRTSPTHVVPVDMYPGESRYRKNIGNRKPRINSIFKKLVFDIFQCV